MPRTKQFDEEEVLAKAMELFWKKGYNGTSIQDLVDHLGVNRASLYNTFGGKDALFRRSLQLYRAQNIQQIAGFLRRQPSIREGIRSLFLMAADRCVRDTDRKGCFVVNTATELIPGHPEMLHLLLDNQTAFEQLFLEVLEEGVQRGEISSDTNVAATAAFLFTLYNGLNVIAKINPDPAHLNRTLEVGLSVLDN